MSTTERDERIESLIEQIEADACSTAGYTGRRRFAPHVMQAIRAVPRHRFVADELCNAAYDNRPLPIGNGQTISQPYIVALMSDLLDPAPDHVVLEVGTGSGYQSAVLSLLVREVFSIEIVPTLAAQATQRLQRLGYHNVQTSVRDGYYGWSEAAPFDSIIVTAAAPQVPPPLIEQLRPGGRLVAPLGTPFGHQMLVRVEKGMDGTIVHHEVLAVAFVPLTGSLGSKQ